MYESMTGQFAFNKETKSKEDLIKIIIEADFDYKHPQLRSYPDTAVSILKRMLTVSKMSIKLLGYSNSNIQLRI